MQNNAAKTAKSPAKTTDSSRGQAPISCPLEVASSGIDTLIMTYRAQVPDSLILRLKQSKIEVQETTSSEVAFNVGETNIFSWNLNRQGAPFYPYVLTCGDLRLCLSSRNADSPIPSMQVSIGSISCQEGLEKTLLDLKMWLGHHKIKIVEEKVQRIDLCADIVEKIDKLDLLDRLRYITRAEKFSAYWSNLDLTGVQIGKGDIVCRIYDKIEEMREKQAGHKEVFFQHLWGGRQTITRVEFQLRRAVIKQFLPDSSSFRDVLSQIRSIWLYCTESWLRQTEGPVDRLNRHQDRAVLSLFWQTVQSAFDPTNISASKRNKKQKHINVRALIKQATGIMLTVAAAAQHHFEDSFGILATISQTLQDEAAGQIFDPGFEISFQRRVNGALVTF